MKNSTYLFIYGKKTLTQFSSFSYKWGNYWMSCTQNIIRNKKINPEKEKPGMFDILWLLASKDH